MFLSIIIVIICMPPFSLLAALSFFPPNQQEEYCFPYIRIASLQINSVKYTTHHPNILVEREQILFLHLKNYYEKEHLFSLDIFLTPGCSDKCTPSSPSNSNNSCHLLNSYFFAESQIQDCFESSRTHYMCISEHH